MYNRDVKPDHKRFTTVTEGVTFTYETPGDCVKLIFTLYCEGSPDYRRILENIYFDGDTGSNIALIVEGIKEKFPEKKLWGHRATKKVADSGSYQAVFMHPLATRTGIDWTRYNQGNLLTRVVSENEELADRIIKELNEILAEPDYWLGEGKKLAIEKFHPKTVDVFYQVSKK